MNRRPLPRVEEWALTPEPAVFFLYVASTEENDGFTRLFAAHVLSFFLSILSFSLFVKVKSSLPEHLQGPAMEVRLARSWMSCGNELSVIHDTRSSQLKVKPFAYEPHENLNVLLQVPDDVLLQHTSSTYTNWSG